MRTLRRLGSIALLAAVPLASSGCLKQLLLDGTISSTRKASVALNTISDYEVARRAASAGLVQLEGYHYLAPSNTDALFMLARGWASFGFGFIEDELERAQDEFGQDSDIALYQKERAAAAYSRAIFYAIELLEIDHPGFDEAKKNAESMNAWLASFETPEDAQPLFFLGQAWMSRVNVLKDRNEYVAELFIGVAAMKRSVELDPTFFNGAGHAALGAYHARSAMAELDEAKTHFEEALAISGGKSLLAKLNYAAKYHCTKGNEEEYDALLTEIVESGDIDPTQRLPNTIAKRRAKRYLADRRKQACAF